MRGKVYGVFRMLSACIQVSIGMIPLDVYQAVLIPASIHLRHLIIIHRIRNYTRSTNLSAEYSMMAHVLRPSFPQGLIDPHFSYHTGPWASLCVWVFRQHTHPTTKTSFDYAILRNSLHSLTCSPSQSMT